MGISSGKFKLSRQPSTKLLKKERIGSRTSKQYDKARTPYQRLLESGQVCPAVKAKMQDLYKTLDPVDLFEQLGQLQERLWKEAAGEKIVSTSIPQSTAALPALREREEVPQDRLRSLKLQRKYKRAYTRRMPVTWRTRIDPFEGTYSYAKLVFQLEPHITSKELLVRLQEKFPGQFGGDELRTLQRRVAKWRKQMVESGFCRESLATASMQDLTVTLAPIMQAAVVAAP